MLTRVDRLREAWWTVLDFPPIAFLGRCVGWLLKHLWAAVADFGKRLIVAAKVLLPVVVGLVLLVWSLPLLEELGLGLSANEVKGYARGLIKCVLYFWVAIALSTWVDARLGISMKTLFGTALDNPTRVPLGIWAYVTLRFPAILYFVATIGGL